MILYTKWLQGILKIFRIKIFFLSCPYILQNIQYLAFQRRVKKIFFLTVQEENYQYPVGWSDRTFLRFLKAGTLLPISYIFISSMTCLVVHACYRFYFQKISQTLNYFFLNLQILYLPFTSKSKHQKTEIKFVCNFILGGFFWAKLCLTWSKEKYFLNHLYFYR